MSYSKLATEARTVPTRDLMSEIGDWVEKLNNVDRGASEKMTSWDSTDDEEDDCHLLISAVETAAPRAIRRPRTAAAPPLVRMDTGEMRDQERRLSDGAVIERPDSKHSIGSHYEQWNSADTTKLFTRVEKQWRNNQRQRHNKAPRGYSWALKEAQ